MHDPSTATIPAATELIPFTAEHFDELASWFASEREVVQWGGTGVRHPLDAAQMQAMLDGGATQPPARLCWMSRRGPDLVGHAQLGLDWRNGIALLGRVAVAPRHRGRGQAAQMLALVLDRAFAIPDVQRIELNVYPFNVAAIRTYERLGFVTEGVRRSSARVGAERWDTMIMSLLRPEFSRDERQ